MPVRCLVIQHPFSNKLILFCIVAHDLNNFILTGFSLLSTAFLVLSDMMIKYIIILLHWSIIVLVFSFDELTFYICPSLWWMLPLLGTFRKLFQQFIQDECVSICIYVHETETGLFALLSRCEGIYPVIAHLDYLSKFYNSVIKFFLYRLLLWVLQITFL